MEYLQYFKIRYKAELALNESFKPYYKWNAFNTIVYYKLFNNYKLKCFKPYYKWNTFNTS